MCLFTLNSYSEWLSWGVSSRGVVGNSRPQEPSFEPCIINRGKTPGFNPWIARSTEDRGYYINPRFSVHRLGLLTYFFISSPPPPCASSDPETGLGWTPFLPPSTFRERGSDPPFLLSPPSATMPWVIGRHLDFPTEICNLSAHSSPFLSFSFFFNPIYVQIYILILNTHIQ
jgi:hypothetical protein